MTPGPEQTHKWLGLVMPLLREGSAVVSLVLLLVGSLVIWWLLAALTRAQLTNRELVERLLTCQREAGELAWKYRQPPAP